MTVHTFAGKGGGLTNAEMDENFMMLDATIGSAAWTAADAVVAADAAAATALVRSDLASTATGKGAALIGAKSDLTGAVARTQHQKNTEIVSVEDFGAIGDGASHPLSGVTSFNGVNTTGWTLVQWQSVFPIATVLTNELDWCAIQTGLNSIGTNGRINFQAKTYLCDQPLVFSSGQRWVGMGGSQVLTGQTRLLFSVASGSCVKPSSSSNFINFKMERIRIDAGTTGDVCIDFSNTSYSELDFVCATGTKAGAVGVLMNTTGGQQCYFNRVVGAKLEMLGGVGIKFSNGANVNQMYGGKISTASTAIWLDTASTGNVFHGVDMEDNSTQTIYVDAPFNAFFGCHLELCPIGFNITANGSSTVEVGTSIAGTVTTPRQDVSKVASRLANYNGTTDYLQFGNHVGKSTYLSGTTNLDHDFNPILGTSAINVRWGLNTTTSGARKFIIYNFDGTSGFGFDYTASSGVLACNAFSVANQVVAATGNWRAHSLGTFKYRNNANSGDLNAFFKTSADVFNWGDVNAGSLQVGFWGNATGINVASTGTITPSGQIFHVTGTSAIATINLPFTGFTGSIKIIPDAAFTTTTAGNIGLASTAVIGKVLEMTYDGTKWWPSY